MLIASDFTHAQNRDLYNINSEINFQRRKTVAKIKENIFEPEISDMIEFYSEKYDFKTKKPIQWCIKRIADYTVAAGGVILTSPIMLITAAAIKLESKGPAIFKQTRIGYKEKPFTIYKFRSMILHDDKDFKLGQQKNDIRVTKVGKLIRKFSIDEIPQFFNILKGDISLIGPRPITAKEQFFLDKEAPDNVKRYATMPGAMLNYPRLQKLTPKPRTAIEENYLENWSLKTDIKHFYKTIKDIISGNNF